MCPHPALSITSESERWQLLCLHDGTQPRPRSRALPTWPSTSRNEEIIDSKRLVTAHFKGACGQQLPLGPGGATSMGHVCPMCLGTETRMCVCAAQVLVCIMHMFMCGPHGSKTLSACRKVRLCMRTPVPATLHACPCVRAQARGRQQPTPMLARASWTCTDALSVPAFIRSARAWHSHACFLDPHNPTSLISEDQTRKELLATQLRF